MKPFVKWAGGKRQILDRIMKYINDTTDEEDDNYRYVEPFLGGGAVFFHLHPKEAIINDLNSDLMNAYEVIKSDEYINLIDLLKKHNDEYQNDPDDYYYKVRSWDRLPGWPNTYSPVERAARMIFLNRTCYNGLYRVNSKGEFNTPIGRYLNPLICDEKNIIEIHNYFYSNNIIIRNESYESVLNDCTGNDLIYIDPPYDYKDDDGFTKYQMAGFTFDDFKKLKECCDEAIDRGACVVISNNATDKVLNLFLQDVKYTAYYSDTFNTLRNINCKGGERKSGYEVIIVGVSYKIVPQANDMHKIINLASSGEKVLVDKDYAKDILGVSTERQVAYYLSALKYFDYVLSTKEFSPKLKTLNNDVNLISADIYSQLIKNNDFVYHINNNSSKAEIARRLKEDNPELADSTAERRASTIYAWIEWMKGYR